MAKKFTREELIDQFNKVHKNQYDYSLVPTDAKSNTVIQVICPVHGEFSTKVKEHKRNDKKAVKCNLCFPNTKRLLQSDVIEKAKEIHKDKYTYDNFVYTTKHVKTYVTCKLHGDWLISPNNLLKRERL